MNQQPPRHGYRKRTRKGILKPTSHSSRRYVPCSLVVWGVPITVKTLFLGLIQLMLPVSMCRMGYSTTELTFGDWILRVLMIFTFTLVLLLLLVDTTLSLSSNNPKKACRIQITPAEQKRRLMSSKYKNSSTSYLKIVSFAKGTKFFRLPRPKSKRQLLREQQELQEKQQENHNDDSQNHPSTSTTSSHHQATTPNRYPTLAGMTPPPPPNGFGNHNNHQYTEMNSTPDWKRAHRLLRAAMRGDPPAHKHDDGTISSSSRSDDREDISEEAGLYGSSSSREDVREESASTTVSKNLFHDRQEYSDGFDADSERDDDDDTRDNLSAAAFPTVTRSASMEDEDDSTVLKTIVDDEEDSMILFEDDDDTYDETIRLGTHTCYSPLRSSESEDSSTLEAELEEALVETIHHLSPTRLCI